MDLATLSALADAGLAHGAFTLSRDAVEGLSPFFDRFLPAGLRLEPATRLADGADGAVRVQGRLGAPVLGVADADALVELGADGDGATIRIVLSSLPIGWTPAASFPSLAGSCAESFAWSEARMTIDSRPPPALPAGFEEALGMRPLTATLRETLRGGITLDALLHPGPRLGRLGWLVGTPRVSGPVEVTPAGVPRLRLSSAALADPATVGSVSVPIRFELAGGLVELDAVEADGSTAAPGAAPAALPRLYARLAGDLAFGDGADPVVVPLSAAFSGASPGQLSLAGELEEASAVLFSALPDLLGGTPLDALVPEDGPGLDDLRLQRVEMTVSLARGTLTAASARVGLAEPWTIGVDGKGITLSDLRALFTVVGPGAPRAITDLTLAGTASVDGLDAALEGFVSLPGLSFRADLAAGSTVDIAGMVKALLPELEALPGLVAEDFRFSGNARAGAFALTAALSGGDAPWTLPVGVTELTVESVTVAVDHDPRATPKDRGHVGGVVTIGDARFVVGWGVPGALVLRGVIPRIGLEEVANALCGAFMDLPDGFPDLAFEDANVTLTAGKGAYDFTLDCDVAYEGMDLGTVLFQVQKSTAGTGFLAGFAVPAAWSPAELWPELEEVMGWLTLRDPGLVLSSLPAAAAPPANLRERAALPSTLPAGVTFFAGVDLAGPLEPVGRLFGGAAVLHLAATIARQPRETRFIASTGTPAGAGSVGFQGLSLILAPGAGSVELRSGATIHAGDDVLDFTVAGILETTGALTAALSLRGIQKGASVTDPSAGWTDPFGLPGLTIYGLGGSLGVETEGWTVALEGELSAGAGSSRDRLVFGVAMEITNGALPSAAVASLRSTDPRGVSLTRFVRGLTTVDLRDFSVKTPTAPEGTPPELARLVPGTVSPADVLDQVVVRTLTAYLVADPGGFRSPVDPSFVYRGVGMHADVTLFGLDARADFDFQYTTGVYARGELREPLDFAGILRLTGAEGTGGARMVVDTRQIVLGGDILHLTGALELFGAARVRVAARVRRDRLEFEAECAGVPGVRACTLACALQVPKLFEARGEVAVIVDGDVPLKAKGVDLGTLHLSRLEVAAKVDASVDLERFRFGLDARFRLEDALPEIRFGFTIGTSFSSLAALPGAVLEELRRQGWSLFKEALEDGAMLLRLAETALVDLATDAGTVLKAGYGMTAEAAAAAMNRAGWAADRTAAALEEGYGVAVGKVAGVLRQGGYAAAQVDGALQSTFRVSADQAMTLLKAGGYGAEELTRYYGWGRADAAKMLRTLGYSATEAATALRRVCGMTSRDAAKALRGVSYGAEDAARALAGVYSKGAEDVAKLLDGAGYGSKDLGKVLDRVFGWSAKKSSKFLKETLDYGKKDVEKALKAADYGSKEIEKAMGDLWDDIGGAIGKLF